ncbi:MAG: hypothetical protein ACP5NZ_04365 [Nanobdellota archaeon]
MTKSSHTYDAILLPTGETSFGDRSFPVSKEVIELFKSKNFGYIFVTGGYNGFAKLKEGPGFHISEADDTVNFLKNNGIPPEKIYHDGRSLESIGNFTFPLVMPIYGNPTLDEFKKILVVGKKGHIWRLMDYAKLTMPPEIHVDFDAIPGEHNNGLMAKFYHKAVMNAMYSYGANEADGARAHEFLMKKHPFYSEDWYKKSPLQRKIEMSVTGLNWLRPDLI